MPYVASGGGGGGAVTVAQLPAALGPQASAASLSVTPATGALFSVSDVSAHTFQSEIAADTSVIRADLNAITAQLPAALGPQASAGSLSITPATGASFGVTAAALPLPAGAATSALQTTGNNTLASILAGQTSGTQQTQGNVADGAANAGNPLLGGAVYLSTLNTYTPGQRSANQSDPNGNLRVRPVATVAAGFDGANNSNIYQFSPASSAGSLSSPGLAVATSVFNGSTWDRAKKSNLTARLVSSAATTNATLVKNSAGDVHAFTVRNTGASAAYLKFYDKNTPPVPGTDTPFHTEYLGPSESVRFAFPAQRYFVNGLGYAITGGPADSDTTAVAAAQIVALNIAYD